MVSNKCLRDYTFAFYLGGCIDLLYCIRVLSIDVTEEDQTDLAVVHTYLPGLFVRLVSVLTLDI